MQPSSTVVVLTILVIIAIIIIAILNTNLSKAKAKILRVQEDTQLKSDELTKSIADRDRLVKTYEHIIDADKYVLDLKEAADKASEDVRISTEESRAQLKLLNSKYISSLDVFKKLEETINLYTDDLDVMEYGVYKPVFNFQTSEEYKAKLEYNYQRQKQMIQSDIACYCARQWTVDGSLKEGAKMTKMQKKLMLFAFNGECSALIAKMKWNTATRTIEKVNKTYDAINKLGLPNQTSITYEYLQMKLEELALSHEYLNKLQEEKEEQRMIREQMREEERAKREFEIAEREAKEEEKRYQKAMARVKEDLQYASKDDMENLNRQLAELQMKLSEATAKKERAISMAQQTKVGHIYIISNIGSFGEDVFKIGMTRRLEPMDRVKELGDASVPFFFDVHAIIYSDNAPQMEYDLQKKFHDKRLNKINGRKEFFRVTLEEIEEYVNLHAGATIEITKLAEAKEYRETIALIESLSIVQNEQIANSTQMFPNSLI